MRFRKICIVGLDSYGMLSGQGDLRYVGGESVQHVLLARAWRDLGHDVSIVVHDEGQGARRVIDGITAIAAHKREAGIPGLRFFYPRTTRLVSAMTAADADVYYQSPAGAFTGITAWFCRTARRRFVFRVASDSDCAKVHERIRFWRDRKLYDFGLRRADVRAAQTESQARMLRSNLGLDSSVVNMIVEQPRPANGTEKDIDVLWLSNLRSLKRPELALELARHLPKVRFTLAGGPMPGGKTYYDDVAAAAARLPNVTMLGAVPYTDTGALFDRAKIFLNTSSVEGFPNTFLQAWIRGVPVVSYFDPDDIVRRMQLGRVGTSIDEIREGIRELLEVDGYREHIGQQARDFAHREFTTGVATRYLELLERESPRLRLNAADEGVSP